jgi:hypothetical protein
MRTKSWLAIIQFIALVQIVLGLAVMPGMMHSGDSAILDPIKDEALRTRIRQWHDKDVRFATRLMTGSGVVLLIVATAAVRMTLRDG